jgi:hypothetical protein
MWKRAHWQLCKQLPVDRLGGSYHQLVCRLWDPRVRSFRSFDTTRFQVSVPSLMHVYFDGGDQYCGRIAQSCSEVCTLRSVMLLPYFNRDFLQRIRINLKLVRARPGQASPSPTMMILCG